MTTQILVPRGFALVLFVAVLAVASIAGIAIYRLYFHPLSKYPGPKLAAVAGYWWAWNWTGGKWHETLEQVHEQYGDVVRIAPDELSFASAASLTDIHGHTSKNHRQMLKSGYFYAPTVPGEVEGIVTEMNPEKHRATRRLLSHAFSAKALRDQTTVVLKYVNMFVEQIRAQGAAEEGIDMTEWYNWLTFDIIGDLAFGESFGSVEHARTHRFIHLISANLRMNTILHTTRRLLVLRLLKPLILLAHRRLYAARLDFTRLSLAMSRARTSRPNTRADFFSHLLSDKSFDMTDAFLTAQTRTLVLAGSDTTATALAGLTYYLLRDAGARRILADEVRAAFGDAAQIDADSTAALPYLNAVIEEGLRLFPSVPSGMPRVSPGAYVDGHYVPEGTIVSTPAHILHRSPAHFTAPHTFAPARFLPATHPLASPLFARDVRDAFKPFSLGPRACLGINLAYMELRVVVATLVWHFDWEAVGPDVEWERNVELYTLWRKPELRVRFVPVERGAAVGREGVVA